MTSSTDSQESRCPAGSEGVVPVSAARGRFFNRPINRWWTVVAGTVGSAAGAGTIMVYTYGLLGAAMGLDHGWSRDLVARNMSAFLIGSGLGTFSLGWLISRFGVRLPSGVMASAFGLSFAAVPLLPPTSAVHVVAFLWIGIMGGAATALPYAVSISGSFHKNRGLALGIVVAGGGAGATFGPRIAEGLLQNYGWRLGFSAIGLAAASLAAFGFAFLVRSPSGAIEATATSAERRSGFRAYFRSGDFWKMAAPVLIVSMATFGAMTNVVPLLKDSLFSGPTIASILSIAGLVSWGSRVAVGHLLDKFYAPLISAIIFVGAAVGLIMLTAHSLILYSYIGAALLAVALSSEADLITYMVSRYFRFSDYSRVVGLLWVFWAWSGSLGALLGDASFSLLGSYRYAFYGFALLLLIAVFVIMTLGPYREHGEHDGRGGH